MNPAPLTEDKLKGVKGVSRTMINTSDVLSAVEWLKEQCKITKMMVRDMETKKDTEMYLVDERTIDKAFPIGKKEDIDEETQAILDGKEMPR